MKNKFLKRIIPVIFVVNILFSLFSSFFINVMAEEGITPISAGTRVILPSEEEVQQYGCATYEKEDIEWASGTGQKEVNKMWKDGGSLSDENNWAYVKTPDGQNRYLIAVTPYYGNTGDYLDVHTKDGKTIPCVMGDAKGNDSGGGVVGWYYYKGNPIGHKYEDGTCCVLEIMLKDYSKAPSQAYLNGLVPIEWIQNGGSSLNGGQPVGLNNTYNVGTGTTSGGNGSGDDEASTFNGALMMFIRNVWEGICTAFDNGIRGRNDMTVLYDIKNLDETNSSVSTDINGFVQYYQNDYADVPYGTSNIKNCGCGPTAFAMIASTISGRAITPPDAVEWCGNNYYVDYVGTAWTYFGAARQHFNIQCTIKETTDIDEAVNALKQGRAYVISSQGEGLFTKGGHFIVLAGMDGDGIIVRDPNKSNAVGKGYNDRRFTKNEISEAGTHYWIFSY